MPQTNDVPAIDRLEQPWQRISELKTEIAELDRILLLNDDLIVHHDIAVIALKSARRKRAAELEALAWQSPRPSESQ
jgi:hypothetical protein